MQMEFYRWILILTGVALLGVAYLMGRKKINTNVYHRAAPDAYDPSLDELSIPIGDFAEDKNTVNASSPEDETAPQWQADGNSSFGETNDRSRETFLTDEEIDATLSPQESTRVEFDISEQLNEVEFEGDESVDTTTARTTSFASAVKQAAVVNIPTDNVAVSDEAHEVERNFSEEFETYGEETVQIEDFEEKLVTIHVAAQRDQRFFGNDLKALFDQHGYRFGRMSLYHCTLEGDRVFSIANMVKPGTFDEETLDKFATPGITLFMRLPIELDADVAFDFLIREAKELAEELGGQLRDENRNPLSEQTIQHMRDDIQQYVFRSKRVLQPS